MAIWIDAKEAVPARGYLCLVYCENTDVRTGSNYKIAKYVPQTASSLGIKRWLSCAEPYEVLKDVTHWMPCPAGPDESNVISRLTCFLSMLNSDAVNTNDILKGDEDND